MSSLTQADRLRGALWGLFVGDALAMPAHWYYDIAALQRDYGTIRDYQAPNAHHPSSMRNAMRGRSATCWFACSRTLRRWGRWPAPPPNGWVFRLEAIPERWIAGLQGRAELETEIDTFIERLGEANRQPQPDEATPHTQD